MQKRDKFAANANGGVCKQGWVRPKVARVPARKFDVPRFIRANSIEGLDDVTSAHKRLRHCRKYHADSGVQCRHPGEMHRRVSARDLQKESACSQQNARQIVGNRTTVT
jgi:hypothetical protein